MSDDVILKSVALRQAKASEGEIQAVIDLAILVESVCHPRRFEIPRFPDTDEAEGEAFEYHSLADHQKFYDRVKSLSEGLHRVAFGYEVMLGHACDPEKDYLDFKPGLGHKLLQGEWTKTPPVEPGAYWHWQGNREAAPIQLVVSFSGTSGKCFIMNGQYGIDDAPDCDVFGGWWMPAIAPEPPEEGQ